MSFTTLLLTASLLGTDAVRREAAFAELGEDEEISTTGKCKETDLVQENPGAYFDEQRDDLSNETYLDLCTPRDVCFLMRQLDMDFYLRAREGDMRQFNKDGVETTKIPVPTLSAVGNTDVKNYVGGYKVATDVCQKKSIEYMESVIAKQNPDKAKATATFNAPKGGQFGYKVAAVMDADKCVNPNCKGKCDLSTVNEDRLPYGCLWLKRDGAPILNKKEFSGKVEINPTKTKEISQLCEMDRTLSKEGSMFFSPYKQTPQLGTQKISNAPEKNPSCSFGAMGSLAHLGKTAKSACAWAIANEKDGATRCVLLKLMSDPSPNGWCANIWNSAWGKTTCEAHRLGPKGLKKETQTDEDVRAAILGLNTEPKFALTDASCDNLPDDTLRNHVGEAGALGC